MKDTYILKPFRIEKGKAKVTPYRTNLKSKGNKRFRYSFHIDRRGQLTELIEVDTNSMRNAKKIFRKRLNRK